MQRKCGGYWRHCNSQRQGLVRISFFGSATDLGRGPFRFFPIQQFLERLVSSLHKPSISLGHRGVRMADDFSDAVQVDSRPGVVNFGSALSTICRNVSITGELRFSECLARKIGRFKDMPVTGILTRRLARNSDRSPWTDIKESPMPARTSALHVSGQVSSMVFRIVAFLDDSQCSKSRRVAEPFSRMTHNSSSSELGAM